MCKTVTFCNENELFIIAVLAIKMRKKSPESVILLKMKKSQKQQKKVFTIVD